MAKFQVGTILNSLVAERIKPTSGSAVNIIICLVTVGTEQLLSFATFSCPCTDNTTATTTTSRDFPQNMIYGWVFITVPALALLVLGYAMNVKTWKLLTGCVKRSPKASRGVRAGCRTLLEIFMQALVAPAAWMSVAFLDGKYYACATSVTPYAKPCKEVIKSTTHEMTLEYDINKRQSQIFGWFIVAAMLFFGSLFYSLHRCYSPLTYHHRKYARWYRELESKAFEAEAKKQIEEEVQGATVKKFLSKKRMKEDWDMISTVFNFIRDKEEFALYSRLDQWEADNRKKEFPLQEIRKPGATEDDSSLETPMNETANNNTGIQKHQVPNGTTNTKRNQERVPLIPPPPINQNAGRRRSSFTGCAEEMTSQHQTNQMRSVTSFENKVHSSQKQSLKGPTNGGDLIELKFKSMPNITKAQNGEVQTMRVDSSAPTYDEDEAAV